MSVVVAMKDTNSNGHRLLIQKLESENEHEHYITEVVGTELLHRETTTI